MPAKGGHKGPRGPRPPRPPQEAVSGGRNPYGGAVSRGLGAIMSPSPGHTLLKYIRSGPLGARRVLNFGVLSLCMLLSELLSALSSPNSCGFSSEALCVLLDLQTPGRLGKCRGTDFNFHMFFRIDFWMVFLWILAPFLTFV